MSTHAPSSTVLIVEDETLVRMLGTDILEEAGFIVVEAANADEAMAVLQGQPDVHLLFSDVDMPGTMDGLELAKLVHERWPRIRLLLTSGHHRLASADIPGTGQFVPKPWSGTALVDKIRGLLAA
ncbi:Response regulator receiver domain-containing protein [Sphingobium sp. AP50]|uniref:response regulator n=1 Tax=Sphingobium sp. AP50 TaxID=1884369 RepID=UPI0008BB64D2|nr:response regulator [Sphingobium sp. AP50]SEI83304.1 Response regulator receiver domain-containing protein [Sphingobium sp. AP50]